jgi:hypothetical protein
MRLTRQTNYAMRILMYCAANEGRLSRIPEIAAAYSVSELFLFKILQPLVENGLVETVRGRNGGVRLARPAASDRLRVRVVRDGAGQDRGVAHPFWQRSQLAPSAIRLRSAPRLETPAHSAQRGQGHGCKSRLFKDSGLSGHICTSMIRSTVFAALWVCNVPNTR